MTSEIYGGLGFRCEPSNFNPRALLMQPPGWSQYMGCMFVQCVFLNKLLSFTELFQLVWIETPTNPNLKMIDIKACAQAVHKRGDIILVVDNTFMSAYFQVSANNFFGMISGLHRYL